MSLRIRRAPAVSAHIQQQFSSSLSFSLACAVPPGSGLASFLLVHRSLPPPPPCASLQPMPAAVYRVFSICNMHPHTVMGRQALTSDRSGCAQYASALLFRPPDESSDFEAIRIHRDLIALDLLKMFRHNCHFKQWRPSDQSSVSIMYRLTVQFVLSYSTSPGIDNLPSEDGDIIWTLTLIAPIEIIDKVKPNQEKRFDRLSARKERERNKTKE